MFGELRGRLGLQDAAGAASCSSAGQRETGTTAGFVGARFIRSDNPLITRTPCIWADEPLFREGACATKE